MFKVIDINDKNQLNQYLIKKGFIAPLDDFVYEELRGGVSCKVVKVTTKLKQFVLKQARPQLQVKDEWFSDVRRIFIERDCLIAFNQIIPDDVPHFIDSDDEQYLLIMEAAPENSETWKEQLLQGKVNADVTKKIARAIAKVHVKGMSDRSLHERFKSTQFFEELRIDPYLETIKEKHPSIRTNVDQVVKMLLEEKLTLVHGDFSPKNILVSKEDIYLLDYEVAHIGHPAFDLAFLTNHLLLKAVKNKQWKHEYMTAMTLFVEQYFDVNTCVSREKLELETIQTLALLFLARVDGKSPVEYITAEEDKELIRESSFQWLASAKSFQDVQRMMIERLSKVK